MTPSKTHKIYPTIGAAFVLIITFHYLGWLRRYENLIINFSVPILSDAHGLSIQMGNNYQFFKNRSDFIKAYNDCSITSEKTVLLASEVTQLTTENSKLRTQLNYFQGKQAGHVLAEIVGREILDTDQTIIINRGGNDGIKINDPVVVDDGILIGKIIKIQDTISIVRLLNDNSTRIASTILNHDRSLGVVEGGFGISLKMNLIPRDEIILANDQVVTSGLETSTPRGLLIGSVTEIENEPYKPFQQAIITPATNFSKLTLVSVLLTQ